MVFKTISISIIFVKIQTFIIDIAKSPEKNVNVKLKMWTFNYLILGSKRQIFMKKTLY